MSEKIRITLAVIGALLITVIGFQTRGLTDTLVIGSIIAVVLWMILSAFSKPTYKRPKSLPADFQIAYHAKNIALDTNHDRVWLQPDRGDPVVLDRSQISEWSHEWLIITAGVGIGQKRNNRIVFKVKDLMRPTLTVKFPNYRTAEEWQARLTAWKNG
jgi:hypothetical protein